jgi:hypothetical protein
VPAAFFEVAFAHNFHCNQSIVVANFRISVQYHDYFLVVFVRVTMAMFGTKRTQSIENFDGQHVSDTKMLARSNEHLLVDT